MRLFLGFVAAMVLVSCGGREASGDQGGPASSATVSGTWSGQSISASNAIAFRSSRADESQILVVLTDSRASCSADGSDQEVSFLVTVRNATRMPAIAAGAYSVDNSEAPADRNGFTVSVGARYAHAMCDEPTAQATGGLVTFTEATDSSVAGSFRFRFATGDELTGSFDAPVCDADLSAQTCLPRAP